MEPLNEKHDVDPIKDSDDLEQDSIEEDDGLPLEVRVTIPIAFVNQFFYYRQTGVFVGYSVVSLLSLPMGHFMARILPMGHFKAFGRSFSLNPGPFSIKEHVLIGIMISCNSGTAYAVDIVVLQKLWYNSERPFIAGWLLVLTTQITGFSLAGALRRLLVRPVHMVWPQTLVFASLFRSLHAIHGQSDSGRMSRMKYFTLVVLGMFVYQWFPSLIFPTLGVLSWICWIKPNNIVLAQLTGSNGLGIGTISLDWSAISQYISPLIVPWFAQVNVLVGFVLVVYIIVPAAYYNNLWGSKNFPIVSANLFLGNGTSYNESAVISGGHLNEAAYREYGPLRMASFFALTYGIGFAGMTATIVHVALYNGQEIMTRLKSIDSADDDIHSMLMRQYPEVPDWWYGSLFAVSIAFSFLTCTLWNYMPWWALLLALAISAFFVLPVGIIQAITNQQPALNIMTEYVIGYLLPGNAIANVTFKSYGYVVNMQALTFVADLKFGHYMKIPPKVMFMAQLISTIVSCTVNLGATTWLINNQPHICTDEGYPFTCRSTRTFYSASIIWGAIGPARVFGHKDGALYSSVQWGFLIGALLPAIFWSLSKVFRRVLWLKNVHWPVLLTATANMPPALPYMYSNGLFVGFIFAFLLRRYRYDWWARYNYLTSAAFDTGVALSGLVIYFTVQIWNGAMPFWWGNPNPDDPDVNARALDHCGYGELNYYGA
ncbi:hypothetical protein BGX31_003803 [Mortierella sp. GBA43]|nr:hypothetical protein BGX31_003803 [Mortierella sp. GBA43]